MTDSPIYKQPTESPDYLRCMDYLLYRELGVEEQVQGETKIKRYTMQEIADRYGISRQAVYKWVAKWEASGLLQMCRDVMALPIVEEYRVANRLVLTAYPEMIQNMVKIVNRGKYDRDRIEAFKVLEDKIVKPQVEQRPEVGAEEAAYISMRQENPSGFNPHGLLDDDNYTTDGTKPQPSSDDDDPMGVPSA